MIRPILFIWPTALQAAKQSSRMTAGATGFPGQTI